jgi:hypothetical protein
MSAYAKLATALTLRTLESTGRHVTWQHGVGKVCASAQIYVYITLPVPMIY